MDKIRYDENKLYDIEFEIVSNGYSPREVDMLLDDIIADYAQIKKMEEYYTTQNVALQKTNSILRNKISDLEMQLEMSKSSGYQLHDNASNIELIKKIAMLENELYQTKLQLEEAKN
ncbi:MAG: DivIVA domain-containing protein [Bacilli bacterium]|nr:DivIVA domain-containing protein [Bacilli bacterium]